MTWLLLVFACGGGGPGELRLERPEGALVFSDVAVFDPETQLRTPGQDVVVDQGRIQGIAPHQAAPDGAFLIEGHGRTLMPGLVDAHTHLGSPASAPGALVLPDPEANLRGWLAAGVTTIFDMGGRIGANRKLATRIEHGTIAGPRIYSAPLPITAVGGHPIPLAKALLPKLAGGLVESLVVQVAGPEGASAAIDQVLEERPDFVKLILDELPAGTPELSPKTVQALVEEAHARGSKVVIHVGSVEDLRVAIQAGVDLIAHAPHQGTLTDADLVALQASGIPVVATLAGFEGAVSIGAGTWHPSAADLALGWGKPSADLEGEKGREFSTHPVLGPFTASIDPAMADNVRRMAAAGVTVLVGSDGPLPGVWAGSGTHAEIHALAAAGLPLPALLAAACRGPRDLLDPDAEWGRMAPGAVADLLLVEGDPTTDIDALEHIAGIWQGGAELTERPIW